MLQKADHAAFLIKSLALPLSFFLSFYKDIEQLSIDSEMAKYNSSHNNESQKI